MSKKTINVEVAYALPDVQKLIRLEVPANSSPMSAVRLSGILEFFPEIDLSTSKLGVFGKVIPQPENYQLQPGDRVEIYRPLIIDPKQARLNRANKKTRDNAQR